MKRERDITNGSVINPVNIAKKRATANSAITESVNVFKQRKEPTGLLKLPLIVVEECVSSIVRVVVASCIEQHRCNASNGIVIRSSSGDRQRSSTNIGC